MKRWNERLIVIGGIAAVAAVLAFVVPGRRQPGPSEGEEAKLVVGPYFSGGAPVAAKQADTVLGREIEERVNQALASSDPEGALIELLSDATPTGAAGAAATALGDIGGERAEKTMVELLQRPEERTALVPYKSLVQDDLFLIRLRLQGLSPEQQVERISQELDAIQANPQRTLADAGGGTRFIMYLGRLGLPQGLDVLHRLIAEELKLPASPIPKEHWLPYLTTAEAIEKIGDLRGISLLEGLHARSLEFPKYQVSKPISGIWWRLKLQTIPQEQWPQFLYDTMVQRWQPGWDAFFTGAGLIGPACLPKMRELALDKHPPATDKEQARQARGQAMNVLARAKDPDAIVILLKVAKDPSEDAHIRDWAVSNLGTFEGSLDALNGVFEVAALAEAEGQPKVLRAAVMSVWRLVKKYAAPGDPSAVATIPGVVPSDDQIAYLRHLAADHGSALVRHNAQYVLGELNLAPDPKPKEPYESF